MKFDVIIVGGGMVGLTLACALAQQTSLTIGVLEAQSNSQVWNDKVYHHRVSAIALASQRIFQALNVWDSIASKRVSPFHQISVWDHDQALHFHSHDIAEPQLGYIIENVLIQSALNEKIRDHAQVTLLSSVKLTGIEENKEGIRLTTADEKTLQASLVIGADGAASWIREQAGIALSAKPYEQTAIVATVRTAISHGHIARQVFLEGGPLAFLPLADATLSSIVWSLPTAAAKKLMSDSATDFAAALSKAFSERLGAVVDVADRFTFPLQTQTAAQYVKSRLALIGDAAHTVHPLAGQGVNMGLLDAASLAEVIKQALLQRRHFHSLPTLRRYERWRKADNQMLLWGIDSLQRLFAEERPAWQSLRLLGLSLTKQLQPLKNMFMRQAVGDRDGLPPLAQKRA